MSLCEFAGNLNTQSESVSKRVKKRTKRDTCCCIITFKNTYPIYCRWRDSKNLSAILAGSLSFRTNAFEITFCDLRIDHYAIARLILTSIITAQDIVFRRSEGRYHAFCNDGKIIDLAVSGLEPGILTQAIFSMGSMAGNFVIL